jgi:two-component system OmpR family response regulator
MDVMMSETNSARVLLIDDEVAFTSNLAMILSVRGYEATAVHDGESAVRAVEEGEFDVAILDLMMPGIDGIETLRQIKRKKPLLEVIMLTGHGSVDTGVEGMNLGAFDYAMKPIDIGDLLEKIADAYQRKLLQEQRSGNP